MATYSSGTGAASHRRFHAGRVMLWVALIFLCSVATLLLFLWMWPPGIPPAATPQPLPGFAEARTAVEAIIAAEENSVNPACHTRLLDHGTKTAKVVLIFHGFSSCPEQFSEIAQSLYGLGYNVLLARMPAHGLADRMTDAPERIQAEQVVAEAQAMVDIAAGLGEQITVVGFSGGGAVAAWLAQYRPDIARVVLISPLLGVQAFPPALTRPISTAVRTIIPNWWGWFNEAEKAEIRGPAYAYPRYSSRALAEYLRLASHTLAASEHEAPAVTDIRMIGNENDETVQISMYRQLAEQWQRQGAAVEIFEFPLADELKHDMIDPRQLEAKIDRVHPVVVDAIVAEASDVFSVDP